MRTNGIDNADKWYRKYGQMVSVKRVDADN